MKRHLVFYKTYFREFYNSQDQKVKDKIKYVLDLIRWESYIPERFLKHLSNTNGIYEIRISTTYKNIRILCFFDEGIVVICNPFVKKSRKTPKSEIMQAASLRKQYRNEKARNK